MQSAKLTRNNTETFTLDNNFGYSSIEDHFLKLQQIKKPGLFGGVFKKQIDPPEEEVLNLILKSLASISSTDYLNFVLNNFKEIQIFFGLSFNPGFKNRQLSDSCIQVSLKMIAKIAEIYIDVQKKKREFKERQPLDVPRMNVLSTLFEHSVGFLSILFLSSKRHIIYEVNTEKLKIFPNLVHRLGNTPGSNSKPITSPDPWAVFIGEVSESVRDNDIPKLITMCQAWFEVFGNLIENGSIKKIEITRDNFTLNVQTKIKQRNKIFQVLDDYCEKLLNLEQQKEGLMGLMEKNLAQYINHMLEITDSQENSMDLDLFKLLFKLINKLFQRRKKLFGSNMDEEELDYYLSGGSEEDSRMNIKSTLSRENHDENSSFLHLQNMTGKLYLQLIEKLLYGPDSKGVDHFNIFTIFVNEEESMNFIEIFEPMFTHKLVKRVLSNFRKYLEKAAADQEVNRRLLILLRMNACSDKKCSCFVSHILAIFFKLSMKCQINAMKEVMDLLYDLLNFAFLNEKYYGQVSNCYLIEFQKMFFSLLSQNLDTIDKMTIQLANSLTDAEDPEEDMRQGNILVMDLRRTVSHGFRKFNLFVDCIWIQGKQVRLTKELCESVLLLLSCTHRVEEFTANQHYKIDLGFDEYGYVTAQDVIEAVQMRWQVKLLSFRTLLVETTSKLLKNLFLNRKSEPFFFGVLRFFKKMCTNRGSSTHSLYLGFITYIFIKEYNMANYNTESFTNFLVVYDIGLRGLGSFDRDPRLSLPKKVQKDFLEMSLQHLKLKFEPQNTRLVSLQLLICYRFQEMFTFDPPIIKCLVPLIFDIANEVSNNLEKIDMNSQYLTTALKLILEESFSDCQNSLLVVMIRLFTSVATMVVPYQSFPIILKPQLMAAGRLVLAGGFPYQTFGDLKKALFKSEHMTSLIQLVDKQATSTAPQVELAKYLSFIACFCQEILLVIYPALLSHCLENLHCSDQVFKVRMQLFMSFLTLDKFVFSCNTALTQFIEKSQGLLLTLAICENKVVKKETLGDSISSGSEHKSSSSSITTLSQGNFGYVKKQWILTLLTKWVFLSTSAQLPLPKLWSMVFTLKQTRDTYLLENCKILESYLSATKGIFDCGLKEIRDPSYFDEGNIMNRKKMHTLMQMIDKFCKDECIEEEARLLQQNFDVNLFEFFSPERKKLTITKLFEQLLSNVKKNEFNWIFLYDSKNIVFYSIAESDQNEICIIKRHISGKSSWFLKESFKDIYLAKEGLDLIDPKQASKVPYTAPNENNLLIKLLELHRKNPEHLSKVVTKPFEENILPLYSSRLPDRVSNFDSYPDYLQEYWNDPMKLPNMTRQASMQSNITEITKQSQINSGSNPDQMSPRESYSAIDSQQRSASQTSSNFKLFECMNQNANFEGKYSLLNRNLENPCLRFILQMEMFSIPSQTEGFHSDYHLISPQGERLALLKNDLSFIDKSRILSCFKVGILFVGPDQDNEKEILSNSFPEEGMFTTFVKNLGEKISESSFAKSLGNDVIQYQVGPLIPRKDQGTFEVKRIVGNVPSLIIWSQNPINNDYENIKSKFNRDIIIVEELSSHLLRIRSLRKIEEGKLETVYLPDSILTLQSLLMILPSYIYASQMELYPIIFPALKDEYKSISPYLDSRKKRLCKLLESNKEDSKRMTLETLLDLVFPS